MLLNTLLQELGPVCQKCHVVVQQDFVVLILEVVPCSLDVLLLLQSCEALLCNCQWGIALGHLYSLLFLRLL